MPSSILRLSKLTPENFQPFGSVLACPGHGTSRLVNEGSAERWDDQSQCLSTRAQARLNFATFRAQPRPMPFEVSVLERHPCSTQIFLPLQVSRYAVVVAEGKERPERLHAFLVPGDTGIAYAPGIWHHTLIALDTQASFACMVWEDGSDDDCHVVTLDTALCCRIEE